MFAERANLLCSNKSCVSSGKVMFDVNASPDSNPTVSKTQQPRVATENPKRGECAQWIGTGQECWQLPFYS